MDQKERQLFTLMWSLVGKYQRLLGNALPTIHDIATTLGSGDSPTAEQLASWQERSRSFDQELHEVTAAFESVRQIADPFFGFDA